MRNRLTAPVFLASTLVLGILLWNSVAAGAVPPVSDSVPQRFIAQVHAPIRVAPDVATGRTINVRTDDLTSTPCPRNGFTGTLSQTHYVYLSLVNKEWENLPEMVTPDDPHYPTSQWNLPQIRAPYAWAVSTGSSGVTIAVVDTGVDIDHPDLAEKLTPGYDFVNDDGCPDDDHGHGTHVAGIAAAATDNAVGIAGLSWEARIMPLKVLDGSGRGTVEDAVEAMVHAVDHGARIVNLSAGSTSTGAGAILQSAVDYVHDRGGIVVAAAGNCGDSNYKANGCSYMNQPLYPASGEHTVAVASTTSTDARSGFSNQGGYVDVAAPGSYIYSTYPDTYRTKSGTSQATPHVAGLAALVWATNPSLSNDQVAQVIEETALDLGEPGRDNAFGHGRIDAYRAVARAAYGPLSTETQTSADARRAIGMALSADARNPKGFGKPLGFAGSRSAEPPTVHVPHALESEAAPEGSSFEPGVILVKLKSETSARALSLFASELAVCAVRVNGRIPALEILRLSVPKGREMEIRARLRHNPAVEYAELNYTIHAVEASQTSP